MSRAAGGVRPVCERRSTRVAEHRGGDTGKHMLLLYNTPAVYEAWTEQERNALFAEVDTIMKELTESGELVGGEALADSTTAKTVRVRDGVTTITDGPYAE